MKPKQVAWIISAIVFATAFAISFSLVREKAPLPTSNDLDLNNIAVEVPFISGIVTAVGDNLFSLEVSSLLGITLQPNDPRRLRTIALTAETLIIRESRKDAGEYNRQILQYNENRAKGINTMPPIPYQEIVLRPQDIAVGQTVTITGVEYGNLKDRLTITAAKVSIKN